MSKHRKAGRDGRIHFTFGFTPEVSELLYKISDKDTRSMVGELTHLIEERARQLGLDAQRHVGQQGRDRD